MKIKLTSIALFAALMMSVPAMAQDCPVGCIPDPNYDPCANSGTPNVLMNCGIDAGSIGWAFAGVGGGTPPYTYSWSVSGGSILTGQGTPTIEIWGVNLNIYATVTVTDSCGKKRIRTCSYQQSGGGGPLKRGDVTSSMTVGELLGVLEGARMDYKVAFEGNLMDAIVEGTLAEQRIMGVVDNAELITIYLSGSNVPSDFDRDSDHR